MNFHKEPPCPLCLERTLVTHFTQTSSVPWRLYKPGSENPDGLIFYRCATCNLIVKDPRVGTTPEQARAHYAKHNNDLSNTGYRAHLLKLITPLAPLLTANASGLDYGCGPILSIEPLLRELGIECTSFDPFFFPSSAPLTNNSHDFITCSEVVEHFADPIGEFMKLRCMLKPRGLLAVMTQVAPQAFESWWYHRDPTHVVFYSPETFSWIARRLNMSLVVASEDVFILQA